MNQYLSRDELAALLGCAPHSYTTMVKRLREMGWPHQPRRGACPVVLRLVHDEILRGRQPTASRTVRPNFEALEKSTDKRKS